MSGADVDGGGDLEEGLVAAVRVAAADGLSDRQIGALVGLSRSRVAALRYKHRIPSGFASPVRIDEDGLRRMVAEGRTDKEIAAVYGVTPVAVRQRRDRLGLPAGRSPQTGGGEALPAALAGDIACARRAAARADAAFAQALRGGRFDREEVRTKPLGRVSARTWYAGADGLGASPLASVVR